MEGAPWGCNVETRAWGGVYLPYHNHQQYEVPEGFRTTWANAIKVPSENMLHVTLISIATMLHRFCSPRWVGWRET